MNMKKTLAGLMAGVVAISAMATVAVSAKAQEAKDVTWSTMEEKKTNATTIVYVTLPAGSTAAAYTKGDKIELLGYAADGTASATVGTGIEIKEITKITLRKSGNTSVIDEDVAVYYNLNGDDATNVPTKNVLQLITDCPDAEADVELSIKVEVLGGADVKKNSILGSKATTIAYDAQKAVSCTNVKKDASNGKEGILLNHTENWVEDNGDDDDDKDGKNEDAVGNAEVERNDTVYVYNLDTAIQSKFKKAEPTYEIADLLKDSKGATIEFIFDKASIDESVSDNTFDNWVDRYDWNADAMKSAISLRINNSNVLSVDMMEFDKTNFSAVYSWDEVMAKFQVGSVAGLVSQMGLKINNDKLPAKKDKSKEVIDLKLNAIRVVIPEMAETNDDTMVEDFAAGESATVVEDTLPAATDAPAADAPAATDAPATTDAADNPETGNSAAALLAIPAALAAAAIVAKKRG